MCKICWFVVAVLVIGLAGMAYKFVYQGKVEKSADGRTAILLDAGERDLVLAEMRAFLESTQQITAAVAAKDMKAAAVAARKVGRAAQQGVPGSLMGKLPLGFKTLGFDTHSKFDELARDANDLGDPQHTLDQLGVLMQNCVGCHAAFRIETVPAGR